MIPCKQLGKCQWRARYDEMES